MAVYIRTHPGSVPTVKQHLAAIRMLGDWLVVSQVLPVNPAAAVRGPKHVVTKGATPVLSPAEARKLLESIDTGTLAALRDPVLSVMLYSFARVSAVLGMRRQDYFEQGSRSWPRLHEKGGKRHDVPAHHRAAAALDAYVEAGRLDEEPKAALFQTMDPTVDAGLPLEVDRLVPLDMTEGSWISLDVSPDGETIVFDFLGDLFTIPISGGDATQLTSGMAFDAQPGSRPTGRASSTRPTPTGDRTSGSWPATAPTPCRSRREPRTGPSRPSGCRTATTWWRRWARSASPGFPS